MSTGYEIPSSFTAEPLSIAVISPDDDRRNAAIRVLDKFPKGRIREFVSYPTDIDTVTQVLKQSFNVVIIDLDSDPEYTLKLVESICANGSTSVIVYSEQTDPGIMVRCLRAGAREFLHMPLTEAAMTEALVRVWARHLEAPMLESVVDDLPEPPVMQGKNGKLLVFMGAKGGSGVTTLACSFAVSLAEQSHKSTLLIDLNLPIGDAALNLGVRSDYTTQKALENADRLDSHFLSTLLVTHGSGLKVLAAPSEMTQVQPSDEAIVTLLNVARQSFEYVVVDAGSRLNLQSTYPCDESTTLYLVTQVGIPELRNANRLIKNLPFEGGPNLEIVINRFDASSHGLDEAHVTKALTRPVKWKIPNDYAAVRKMQSSTTPITQENSQIARAIRQMTQSVCGVAAAPEKKKKKGFSLF